MTQPPFVRIRSALGRGVAIAAIPGVMLLSFVLLPLGSEASAQIVGSASLHVERAGHSATRLQDGRILIVGGANAGGALSTAELYDPATQRFSLTGSLVFPRRDHTATLLSDGRVLIIGGRQGSAAVLTSTEVFDPVTGLFATGPSLTSARSGHSATVLNDGRILITGGDGPGSAEVFDQGTFTFTPVSSPLTTPRSFAGTGVLQDGTVLIVGGADASGTVLQSAEVFTPGPSSFTALASALQVPRANPLLRVLADGNALIIGGNDDSTIEVFDPAIPVIHAYARVLNSSNALSDIVRSRTRSALIHLLDRNNPLLQSQLTLALRDLLERTGYSLTEMPESNRALVVGGVDRSGRFLPSADLIGSSSATVTTDKSDYPPGSVVAVAGTHWQPGEAVLITIHEERWPPRPGGPVSLDPVYWAVADAQGTFSNGQFSTDADDLGRTFTVTAVGQTSGFVAETAFTDAANATWTITPSAVQTGSTTTFLLALTGNTGAAYPTNNTNNACSARLTLTGFTGLGGVTLSATHGQRWVVAAISGSTLTVNAVTCTRGSQPDDELYKGDTLSISVTALASATAGAQTWTSTVYTDTALSQGGGNLTNQNISVVSTSSNTYTAAVSPTVMTAATSASFTVTLTNTTASGGAQAGQAQIAMPPGFSAPSGISATTSGNTCGQTNGTLWMGAGGGNANFVNDLITLKAPGSANLCPNGGTLTVTFTATAPAASGTASWATAMQAGGTVFLRSGNQPTTTVPAGHTTATTLSLTPTSAGVGQSSNAMVTVTDTNSGSQSNPTGAVSFTSSDTGATGDAFTPGSSCTLISSGANAATCSVTVTPNEIGTSPHTITAAYQGDGSYGASTGSASLTVTAGAASTLVFTIQPGSAPAGSPIPGPPTVTVQDGFGNTVTSSNVAITVAIGANPGGGTLAGTTVNAATGGVASFSNLTINQPGSGYTLTASAPGLTAATSNGFAITGTTGTISGTVTAASDGHGLSGALVEALQAGLVKGSVTTGGDGTYALAGVAPGPYDVRASVTGYQAQTQSGITVSAGGTTAVNFNLTATPTPTIRITSPSPDSLIDRPIILVRGEISGVTGMEVGVTVNDNVAQVGSFRFAAFVPVQAGAQTLTAQLNATTGTIATDSVSVEVTLGDSPGMLFLTPSLGSGPAPFQVDLVASFLGAPASYQWDADGNGTIDFTGPTPLAVTYSDPGLYLPTVIVTDGQGAQFMATAPVLVYSSADVISLLLGKWQSFKDALRAGDVSTALQFVVQDRRDEYQEIFQNLMVPLSQIDQVLTDIAFVRFREDSAEFQMLRTDERGELSYLVRFVIDADGIWHLDDL